jgi:DNA-binding XRE family transcriptional regulator
MIQGELKAIRERFGTTKTHCARTLGITVQGYLLKERGDSPISGIELVKLARMYGVPLREAFPSYEPTADELMLAEELNELGTAA